MATTPSASASTRSSAVPASLCEQVMEQALDAILMGTPDGCIRFANRQASALLRRPREELLGRHATELVPAAERARAEDVIARLNRGESVLDEFLVARSDGRTLCVEMSATRIVDSATGMAYLMGVFRDIQGRRQAELERLRDEQRHRDALVREVHHRIKNHLQGLVGLIAGEMARHPEAEPVFAHVMTQISSIAVVHGLQAKTGSDAINLCDMVSSICQALGGVHGLGSTFVPRVLIPRPAVVAATECVPVALVLNELIGNAVKHAVGSREHVCVEVRGAAAPAMAEILISNPGRLPPEREKVATHDLSSGLGLVRALLPTEGVMFRLENAADADRVVTRLRFSAPVVTRPEEETPP